MPQIFTIDAAEAEGLEIFAATTRISLNKGDSFELTDDGKVVVKLPIAFVDFTEVRHHYMRIWESAEEPAFGAACNLHERAALIIVHEGRPAIAQRHLAHVASGTRGGLSFCAARGKAALTAPA